MSSNPSGDARPWMSSGVNSSNSIVSFEPSAYSISERRR